MHEPLGALELVRQFFQNRLKRMVRRRVRFITNATRRARDPVVVAAEISQPSTGFHPGDRVRIKTRQEIQSSLDNWDELKGCGFMEEMWPYCGSEQTIFKRVGRFLDERDYRVKQVRGIYLLEGIICGGTVDFGPCDRSCFFFWREEWLEKVNASE